jgi:SnoaL-like domain
MAVTDDTVAIIGLTAVYNQVIDGGLVDRIGEVFTSDASLSSPSTGLHRQGTDELVDMAVGAKGRFVHVTTDHIVTVDGDTARQRCTLLLFTTKPGVAATFDRLGWYDDELVRGPDGWRFTARVVSFA